MSIRKEAEPLVKVTLNIFKADQEALIAQFDQLGYTKAIRYIIRNQLVAIREQQAREGQELSDLVGEIDFELEEEEDV